MKTETKQTHTPGPWMYKESFNNDAKFTVHFDDQSKGGHWWRRLDNTAGGFSIHDAALIAAAPELLEALKNCVLDLKREYLTPDKEGYTLAPDSVYWEKVRLYEKAIAKAEGK